MCVRERERERGGTKDGVGENETHKDSQREKRDERRKKEYEKRKHCIISRIYLVPPSLAYLAFSPATILLRSSLVVASSSGADPGLRH